MQSQTLANLTIRRGTRVRVENVPGVWLYSHPATRGGPSILISQMWLDPKDLSAERYAESLPYGMLRAETESVELDAPTNRGE